MQTFAPSPDVYESANALDNLRLGKQIVECRQIGLAAVHGGGWRNHPAVEMWRYSLGGLIVYATAMHLEWVERRGKDHAAFLNMINDHPFVDSANMPWWWGREDVHASHRGSLWCKDPVWYPSSWEQDSIAHPQYVWPTRDLEVSS